MIIPAVITNKIMIIIKVIFEKNFDLIFLFYISLFYVLLFNFKFFYFSFSFFKQILFVNS